MRRNHSRRRGISELVASLLTVAITIIAGVAVFGWVNSQAGVSEGLYGQSVGNTVNFLNERFVVVNLNFTSDNMTVWVYNNGGVALRVVQVMVYNSSKSFDFMFNATNVVNENGGCSVSVSQYGWLEKPVLYNGAAQSSPQSGSVDIAPGTVGEITLSLPVGLDSCGTPAFVSGVTYYVNVLGLYGNDVVYLQSG